MPLLVKTLKTFSDPSADFRFFKISFACDKNTYVSLIT